MKPIKAIPLKYLLTALVLLFIYIANFRFDMFVDAGKYAAVSKYIYETGDLIRLKIFGEPYDQKPPFMFWLAALSFRIFGISNFAFKLPTFIFSLLGTFATYKLGEALYNKRIGILAAIMLISSQFMLLYNNDTHTDVVLSMCVVLAIWQLHQFISSGKWWNYLLGFTFAGFAMITKGPIGLAVPVFAIVSHILISKKYKLLHPQAWLPGLLIVIVIITPALVGLYQQFGAEGLKFYFWTNNVGRITGTYSGRSNDFTFYIHTLGYLFLPFSLFTYFGIFQETRKWIMDRFSFASAKEGITLAIPIFLFILSVSKMKSPHYMLPVIPLIAIITAKWTDRIILGELFPVKVAKSLQVAQHILMIILVAGSMLFPLVFFPTKSLSFWIPVLIMAGIFLFYVFKSVTLTDKLIHVSILAILTVNLVLTLNFFPRIYQYDSCSIASRDFNKAASDKAKLFVMNSLDYEIGFYAKNHPRFVADSTLFKLESFDEPWVYTDSLGRNDVLERFPEAQTFRRYKYKRLTKFGLKFLLPRKRFSDLQDVYLVKIKD